MWTSLSNQSYVSVNAHFFDDNFQLVSTLLDVKEFKVERTGSNIAAELKSVPEEQKLPCLSIGIALTDNGRNILRAVSDLG